MASISFAITACNEHVELKRLLDQTLKELQQLEQLLSSDSPIPDDEMQNVVNKLSSAFDLANDELARVEQEVQILSTQIQNDEE